MDTLEEPDCWAESRAAMQDAAARLSAVRPEKAQWLAWFAGQAIPEMVPGTWGQAIRLTHAVQERQPLPEQGDLRGWAALLEPSRDLDAPPAKRR